MVLLFIFPSHYILSYLPVLHGRCSDAPGELRGDQAFGDGAKIVKKVAFSHCSEGMGRLTRLHQYK